MQWLSDLVWVWLLVRPCHYAVAFRFGLGLAVGLDPVTMQWLSGLVWGLAFGLNPVTMQWLSDLVWVWFLVRPCHYAVAFRFGLGLAFGLDPVTMQWLSGLVWGLAFGLDPVTMQWLSDLVWVWLLGWTL
jgi:hypothetical protein